MSHQNRAALAKSWQPLRIALAWRVTDGDKQFVDWVRDDPKINAPDILADCLQKEMVGCYGERGYPVRPAHRVGPLVVQEVESGVEITHAGLIGEWVREADRGRFYTPERGPSRSQEGLAESWTGRLQQVAEDFEGARIGCSKGKLSATDYLRRRFEQAVCETSTWIAEGKLRAKGIPVDGGREGRAREIHPSEITEQMTLRGWEGLLYQGPNKDAPAWKSVALWWADFLKCHANALEPLTVKVGTNCYETLATGDLICPAGLGLPPQQLRIFKAVQVEIIARNGSTDWIDLGKRTRAEIIQNRADELDYPEGKLDLQALQRACRRFFSEHWPTLKTKF